MKRKKIIVLLLLALLSTSLWAQQNTADIISNDYIQPANLFTSVTALSNYRTTQSVPSSIPVEITDKSAYYKISYQPQGSNITSWGLLDVRCARNNGKNDSIGSVLDSYYTLFLGDDDESDYSKETLKNALVHGGFFFNKTRNIIYIVMLSQPDQDFVFATIRINNLTVAQKQAFARDFIDKTVFQ